MRILLCSCLITVALGLSPVVALGDAQSHRTAAENLLIVMEVDKSLPKIVDQVGNPASAKSPARFAARGPAAVSDPICELGECQRGHDNRLYSRIHRARVEEADGVLQDPVGKKANEKMPHLAFLAGQLGLKKAQAHQAELRQTLEDQKSKPGGGG